MDAATKPVKHAAPGISIRNGPVKDIDVDGRTETNPKRKARTGISNGVSYKDASDEDEDDKPLVGLGCQSWPQLDLALLTLGRVSDVGCPRAKQRQTLLQTQMTHP